MTVYASRSLDLLVISSQIFFNLVKYYPKIQEPLKKAFERSKEYILPISMDIDNEADSSGKVYLTTFSITNSQIYEDCIYYYLSIIYIMTIKPVCHQSCIHTLAPVKDSYCK